MIPNTMLPLIYKMLGHSIIISSLAGGLIAADVNFRDQVTLGSIIIAGLLLAIAGLITIRSKIANIWREEAEGERAAKERVQEELTKERLSRAQFERAQQELRHDLKDHIASLVAQIKVLEAKTDLSVTLDVLKDIERAQHKSHQQTHSLLVEIRDKLPSEPVTVKELVDLGTKLPSEPIAVHETPTENAGTE
jgi:hypothetical protein